MAITLRNKRVEEAIRAIGRRTGEGPSAVIARLVAAEEPHPGRVSEEEAARRLARWQAFEAQFPPWTEEDRVAVRQATEEMYNEDGLPR